MLLSTKARRAGAALAGTLLGASALLAGATRSPAAEETAPHWGEYQWYGGAERADVRAFWLFDRTGDANTSRALAAVAGAWNDARARRFPELPHIAVHRDTSNEGKCFVNAQQGYSVASACTLPFPVGGSETVVRLAGSPHLTGGAIGISPGLSAEQAVTAACHAVGRLMGLERTGQDESCMSDEPLTQEIRWYTENDEEAVLDLYAHDERGNAGSSTTTTLNDSTTTTIEDTTTTTIEDTTSTTLNDSTTTTIEDTTTTTTAPLPEVTIPDLGLEG